MPPLIGTVRMTSAERQARRREQFRQMRVEIAQLRAALEAAEREMLYAAEELRKARRSRQHHTMIAAAGEARAALAWAGERNGLPSAQTSGRG